MGYREVGIVGETMDEELLRAAQTMEPGMWLKAKGQEKRSCPGRDQKGLPRVILKG